MEPPEKDSFTPKVELLSLTVEGSVDRQQCLALKLTKVTKTNLSHSNMDHLETYGNRQTAYLSQSPAVKLCSWEKIRGSGFFCRKHWFKKNNWG